MPRGYPGNGQRRPPVHRSLFDRFWAKVDDSGGPDACHRWTGAVSHNRHMRDGYGHIRTGGRGYPLIRAHIFALILATGEDQPPGLEAGHGPTCTTTLCCNGRHLRWVTRLENEHDKRRLVTDAERVALVVAKLVADGVLSHAVA